MNYLYFGDCLDVLKRLHHENSKPFIDLIYIDPPFNSKRNYNVLFESIDLKDANAQKQAFADTWSNVGYRDTMYELADINRTLHSFLESLNICGFSESTIAYLTTMAIRIYYMHGLLKDTGSFYLHCDSTMSHYLKIVCDLIFGEKNFKNEIIWKRTNSHSDSSRYPRITDSILFYSKSKNYKFNKIRIEYEKEYLNKYYNNFDSNGKRFAYDNFTKPKGSVGYFYKLLGVNPPSNGWRMPEQKAIKLAEEGFIEIPPNGKTPRFKRYLDSLQGLIIPNLWEDLNPINSQAKEALGYPTQKPQELMERIIAASTDKGDVVADFFCGCGTTVAAAQKLERKWLGSDISHLAINLIKKRLVDTYGENILKQIKLDGFPKDIASAHELAQNVAGGRLNFQDWVIEVLLNGVSNIKKSADGGFDGYITFNVSDKQKEFILIEVKSGNVNVKNIREFIQVIEKQKAAIGIFVCFQENLTKEMTKEAKHAGYYYPEQFGNAYDKIQILTVEDLMDDRQPRYPDSRKQTFKKATKEIKDKSDSQKKLFE